MPILLPQTLATHTVLLRTSNNACMCPTGARWSSPSPRGMEMETKEREMEMGMGINSRAALAHARRLRYEHERQRSSRTSSADSGHMAAVFLAHPYPYSHAHSHHPPPLPPSLPPFSLTLIPDAPRTVLHSRCTAAGDGDEDGLEAGVRAALARTTRHAAANNAAPNRAELVRVDSRGVADASPAPRLQLSHRRQAASRRAMPPARSIVKRVRGSRVRRVREIRLPWRHARRRPVGKLLY
ncbi:hypothetical protein DFH08DRAFT_977628 [Mycena albidolilacea]|uniref:Uncharacterized protein n=1 Tax=Mycena albidolilacea TaxID=1033008 RepID=A0AAD6Z014_9AGAR|nr:hypothetical protein DFH08DRAFT_977628 [Mycena albidolilacea]